MRTVLTLATITLLVAACASQPKSTPGGTAAAPAGTAVAPATSTAAVPAASTVPASGPKYVAGYVRVVKGGTTVYCRDDVQTGSHLMVKTTCLSEHEFNALADDTRRDVERIRNTMSGMH